MAALAAAVRPFAGGVPRRAVPAPTDGSERASGMKPPRVDVVAPAQGSSVCLAGGVEDLYVPSQKRKMTCLRNNFVESAAVDTKVSTVGGEMSSDRELLQKRLASELDILRGLLKKAELISQRGPCNGGAPTAGNGNRERFLASNSEQRSKPMEDGGANAPSLKRRMMSTLVEEKPQKQVPAPPPRMSAEERSQFACRLSSLSGEVPGQIVEFLLKQFGDADADAGGEIEINIDSVEDSVLFEMKTQLDKFAQERPFVVDVLPAEKDDEKLAEESRSEGVLEQDVKTGSRPRSRSSSSGSDTGSDSACKSDSDELPALREALPEQVIATSAQQRLSEPPASSGTAQSGGGEAKKAQDVQRAAPRSASLAGLIYRAKVRRELMEMEKAAALPDESIHPQDLQRLGIGEYGHPSLMRQLGLFLKADDA